MGWSDARRLVAAAGWLLAGCESHARASLEAGLLDASFEAGLDAASSEPRLDAAAWLDSAVTRDAGRAAHALPWLRTEVALEPDGRTALLSFSLAAPSPVFALRTYGGDGLCFQLEEVRADEATWVPKATSDDYGDFCTRCEQRVAVGRGYGMFVLPSSLQPASVGTLLLRIALRDCLTLSPLSPDVVRPSSLTVESASFSAPHGDTPLNLPLQVVLATPFSAQLDGAVSRMREIWRLAGIELVLRGTVSVPRPDAPVEYSATDRQALSALAHAADDDAAVLVLTPCLVRSSLQGATQPLAITTHVPGGFGVAAEPDAIFVAAERCGGLTPAARYLDSDSLAAVMAHELGHYLGLFHVQESDGREDTLMDTRADEPNLMQALPHAGATTLTASQIAIARRHPLLAAGSDDDQQ